MSALETPSTLIEAVKAALAAAKRFNSGDAVAPAAILWTDAGSEWRPIAERLSSLMPELLTLGPYDPAKRSGPAIWMRCVIEGMLEDIDMPPNTVPVLYLPQVSRQVLRSPEECPDELKPLVELQYRGTVWTQVNGKDWTTEAFLVSGNGGLGLDVSRDQKTKVAMQGAMDVLATTPIASLRGRRLEAEDFDRLTIGDTVRDLLLWLSEPAAARGRWDEAHWSAFRSRCRDELDFDPLTEGEIVAAEKLGMRLGAWSGVWQRFVDSPMLYPGIPAALRRGRPTTLIFDREPWPDENESDEAALRSALSALGECSPNEAREALKRLDQEHGQRRAWVWARMGRSPLAMALEQLKELAEKTQTPLLGGTLEGMADAYASGAYRADEAALRATECVRSAEDRAAVVAALRTVYLPWLEDSARNFQTAMDKLSPLDGSSGQSPIAAEEGQCLLFADGLRYDLAQRLLAKASERQLQAIESFRWAPLPTVTPTAKPAVTPVAGMITGGTAGANFCPVFSDSGKEVTSERLRDAIAGQGYQILGERDTGQPVADSARGWAEYGEFDALGHKLQAKFGGQVEDQLDLLLDRVVQLLDAGWSAVRVVTDHGWLLMPGGLPSMPLKKYLTECKWARCAVIKEGAKVDVMTAGWYWDPHQLVAYAPGVYCFSSGNEYAHGGMSIQERLVPNLILSKPSQGRLVAVKVEDVQWLGLRCRARIAPAVDGLLADLRSKPNDPGSSICQVKPFDKEGRVGLLVEDEGLAGTSTTLVVLDASGRVLSKHPTIVGGES